MAPILWRAIQDGAFYLASVGSKTYSERRDERAAAAIHPMAAGSLQLRVRSADNIN